MDSQSKSRRDPLAEILGNEESLELVRQSLKGLWHSVRGMSQLNYKAKNGDTAKSKGKQLRAKGGQVIHTGDRR